MAPIPELRLTLPQTNSKIAPTVNESQKPNSEGFPHAVLKHVETLRALMSTMDVNGIHNEEIKNQTGQVVDMEKMVSMPLESIEHRAITSFLENILSTTRR